MKENIWSRKAEWTLKEITEYSLAVSVFALVIGISIGVMV